MKIQRYLEKKFSDNRNFVKKLKKNFRKFGVNLEHWERYPTYKQIRVDLANINLKKLDVLEISAGEFWKENFEYNSYTSWDYPQHDICDEQELKEKFDFIIADNVWEHLKYPYRATKNIYKLLKNIQFF